MGGRGGSEGSNGVRGEQEARPCHATAALSTTGGRAGARPCAGSARLARPLARRRALQACKTGSERLLNGPPAPTISPSPRRPSGGSTHSGGGGRAGGLQAGPPGRATSAISTEHTEGHVRSSSGKHAVPHRREGRQDTRRQPLPVRPPAPSRRPTHCSAARIFGAEKTEHMQKNSTGISYGSAARLFWPLAAKGPADKDRGVTWRSTPPPPLTPGRRAGGTRVHRPIELHIQEPLTGQSNQAVKFWRSPGWRKGAR